MSEGKRLRDLSSLVGEVLESIDIDDDLDQILLTTRTGRTVLIKHVQDCCESVKIESTDGEWKELVGKVLIEATNDESNEGDAPEFADSWTRTVLTFKVDDATVINRWIGESNGYYSESVSFYELGAKQ